MARTIASCSGHSRPIRHIKWEALVFSIECALDSISEVLHALRVWFSLCGIAAVASLIIRVRVLRDTAIIHVAEEISGLVVASIYCGGRCLSLNKTKY